MIDMVHLPKYKSGHQWLLTMVDVCSRWGIATPMKDMGHEEVALQVLEEWARVGVHVAPKIITHDGGNEFKSRFEDMCHVMQKQRHISISDRPEGHGIIERYNRDIMQLIAKMCPTGKQDQAWPWIAPAAMEAHNAAIHNPMSQGSIGITPSEIMHGAKPLTKAGLDAS